MPQQDTSQTKAKILTILRLKGPSLPVHVAKETGLSILFASAFLSELVSDKQIKISNMKVGGSPIYFLPNHAPLLERFAQHLKSKDRDAYELLKQKKFIADKEPEPAIRVALRGIKDFAIPFEHQGELFWRYHTAPESEFKSPKKTPEPKPEIKSEKIPEISVPIATKLKIEKEEKKDKQKELDIFDKSKPLTKHSAKAKPTKTKKSKKVSNKEDKFFTKVKEALAKKGIEISDIVGFSKSDLTLKVNDKGQEKLLVAYNKRKISESDILKAHKKALGLNLPYIILGLGEPSKKLRDFIQAAKALSSIEKI
jgi:hypothetical protein